MNPTRAQHAFHARSLAGQSTPGPDADSRQRSSESDGSDRRRSAGGVHWHLQRRGSGQRVLLLHGTGASTHSWAGLLPGLAERFEVLAPDLPGHGRSSPLADGRATLPAMAEALAALLDAEAFEPEVVIGHSAGAALALRMALDQRIQPRLVIGLNAALLPYGGLLAPLAQPLARLFAALDPVARLLAARARQPGTVERLIAGTGSRLPPEAIDAYRELLGRESHVAATLAMMAHWDLQGLKEELRGLEPALCLVVGEADRTVPASQATGIAEQAPRARVIRLPGLGHLAHEERPLDVLGVIVDAMQWGLEPAP